MIFSSVEFLLFFLPLFLAVYGLTPARMKNITLLGGSLIFYAWGEPRYLLLLMVSVLVNFYAGRHLEASPRDGEEEGDRGQVSLPKQILVLAICAGLLYVGANLLVDNGILIAQWLGGPERGIAVTFIALGTSLPELVTSVVSLIKGFGNVGLGNVIGANILNMLLVIGIPSAVAGIPLERSTVTVDMPLSCLVMAVLLVPILARKKSSRLQGAVLLGMYGIYCVMSFI